MLVHLTDLMGGLVWSGVSKAPPAHHSRDSDCDTEKQCPRIRSQHGLSTHPPNHARLPYQRRFDLHASNYTAIITPNLLSPLPSPSLA
jgi:hypothetical protein